MVVIFFTVSLLASIIGAICGIGGGVIIKPVLDATGSMNVSSISFLSGCTVLSMSIVSVIEAWRNDTVAINVRLGTLLAMGAAMGGLVGKCLFQYICIWTNNENTVGFIQSVVMSIITFATLIYILWKHKVKTYKVQNLLIVTIIGVFLGILSSFLGIGGGPINILVLTHFFSMKTKEAAINSIYIIMFSQITSLIQVLSHNSVPDVPVYYILFMIIGGVLGGMIGNKVNRQINTLVVDRLFIVLMVSIVGINIINAVKFAM